MDNTKIAETIAKAIDAEIKRLMTILRKDETNAPILFMQRIQDLVTTRDTLRGIATWGFDFINHE